MVTLNQHWQKPDGKPDGGVSLGIGYTIAWQRGSLSEGRNGAFLIEVLEACQAQLEYYQTGELACSENAIALEQLNNTLQILNARLNRRHREGVLGTHD